MQQFPAFETGCWHPQHASSFGFAEFSYYIELALNAAAMRIPDVSLKQFGVDLLAHLRAELDGIARASEEEAKIAGEKARAVAAQALEAERIELEKRRLQADVVLPAQAELEAQQMLARADAATIVEEGAAQVEVFKRLTDQYRAAGDDAHDILVLNMLPDLVDQIVSTVNAIDIEKMTVIDSGGDGSALPNVVRQLPQSVISIAEVNVPSVVVANSPGAAVKVTDAIPERFVPATRNCSVSPSTAIVPPAGSTMAKSVTLKSALPGTTAFPSDPNTWSLKLNV